MPDPGGRNLRISLRMELMRPFAPLLLLLASSTALAAPAPKRAAEAKPSVVLVTLDTTRADRLGCYGRQGAGTPTLDALAARGVRFDEAWSAVPVTLPSHVSMMTGCYPVTNGVRDNGDTRYDGRVPTLATRFSQAGWATAAVVSAAVLDSTWGAGIGFGTYDDRFGGGSERNARAATDRALEIVDHLSRPFFLWVHYYDAHWKYEPPPEFAARFKDDPYQGEISFVDSELGRLLAALEARGVKPILVVAGDHGEGLGDHGERTHGIFTYRSTLRVPLLVAGPGIAAGRVEKGTGVAPRSRPDDRRSRRAPPCEAPGRDFARRDAPDRRPAPRATLALLRFHAPLQLLRLGAAPRRDRREAQLHRAPAPRGPRPPRRPGTAPEPLGRGRTSLGRPPEEVRHRGEPARRVGGRSEPGEDEPGGETRLASLGYLGGLSSKGGNPTLDPKDVVDLADKVDKAKELHERNQWAEAIALADEIIARNPENVPALSIRGQALLASKRYREAAQAFTKVIERNPGIAIMHFNLGSSFEGLGDVERAEASWKKAWKLEPHFAEPRASTIASRLGRGDTAGALAVAKEAASSGAESAELLLRDRPRLGHRRRPRGGPKVALRGDPDAPGLRRGAGESGAGRVPPEEDRRGHRALPAGDPGVGGKSTFRKTLAAILLNDRQDAAGALEQFRAALAVETDPAERQSLSAIIADLEGSTGPR